MIKCVCFPKKSRKLWVQNTNGSRFFPFPGLDQSFFMLFRAYTACKYRPSPAYFVPFQAINIDMADRLEGSMQRFLDDQLYTIPRELTVVQVLDLPSLQQNLQQILQDSFDQQYRPLEAKIKRDIEEMGKNVERKEAEIRTLVEGKQRELEGLKGEMMGNMQKQTQFVGEIERIAGEIGSGITQSYHQARDEIWQMHEKVMECDQMARNLFSEIEKKQMKADIVGDIEVEGGDKVTFELNNRKMYCLEGCVLRFLSPDDTLYFSGLIEPVVPGYQKAKVFAQIPDNFVPDISYQVAVWRNDAVISKSVQFVA